MNKKKFTVSIGITAYNEELNIKKLLLSLLIQKTNNFILKEIIVVSDHSTDRTVREIKKVNSKKIKLIQSKKREGSAISQGKISKIFGGDILILLNADVLPKNDLFIEEAVKPFYRSKKIGLVGMKLQTIKASTLFEEIINYSVRYKKSIFTRWNRGNNLLLCCGGARAFSRAFAKSFKWTSMVSEDAYSYLQCINKRYLFIYNPKSVAYYKSPDNFSDHLRQSSRFVIGPKEMSRYFDKNMVERSYKAPLLTILLTTLEYFIKNPFYFISYLSIFLYIKLKPGKDRFLNPTWLISKSSKELSLS